MGRRKTKKSQKSPDRAHVGDDGADHQSAGGGAEAEEEVLLERDVLIVTLVQINAEALAETSIGDPVQVSGASIVAEAGPLGKIPAKQLEAVSDGAYGHGQLTDKESPTVQLHE
jgi:hypothetical protein